MLYLIGGTSRCGKTTVRKELLKQKSITGIDTDILRTMLEFGNPDLKINGQNSPELNLEKMQPYLEAVINDKLYYNHDFVLEGDVITPELVSKFHPHENLKFCFIGHLSDDLEEKLKNIREFAEQKEWTKKVDDKEIKDFIADRIILRGKSLYERCQKLGYKFFDTSKEFSITTQKVVEYLLNN